MCRCLCVCVCVIRCDIGIYMRCYAIGSLRMCVYDVCVCVCVWEWYGE
jgi:hypothetical protein